MSYSHRFEGSWVVLSTPNYPDTYVNRVKMEQMFSNSVFASIDRLNQWAHLVRLLHGRFHGVEDDLDLWQHFRDYGIRYRDRLVVDHQLSEFLEL